MHRRLVFGSFSLLYYGVILLLLVIMLPFLALFFRGVLVRGLGITPEAVGIFLIVSLLGSFLNVPLTEIRSHVPIYTLKRVSFFGVAWRVPIMEMGVGRTLVTLNVGGALVPLLFSFYLLVWSIPALSPNPSSSYLKAFYVLSIVALVVNRSSRLIRGLGIATPAIIPPLVTTLSTVILHWFNPLTCPTQVAFIGGTLGTLIGADLLNLRKIPQLGAPVVSIGGAGTFDGIYSTGLISVLLVLFLL